MKSIILLFQAALALMAYGCAPSSPTPAPGMATAVIGVTTPVAVPTTVPASATARAPAPSVPPQPTVPVQGKTYSDPALGISFVYPADWENLPRAAEAPPGVTLHAPPLGTGIEPIIFAITVDVQPVTENSVEEVVAQQLAQVPPDLSGGIRTRMLTVGGEPAEEVIGLPSQAGAIETFILHEGRIYLIILQPYDESNGSLQPYLPQVRGAYDGVLSSWKFLK